MNHHPASGASLPAANTITPAPWRSARGEPPAFTLIELLVTLAVITVVLALIAGPLAKVKDAGRQIRCLSNLRSLHAAVEMYRADYRSLFPYADTVAELYPAPIHALAPYWSITLPGQLSQPQQAPAPLWCAADRLETNTRGITYVYTPWDLFAAWPGVNPQRSASLALDAAPDELLFTEWSSGLHNAGAVGQIDVKGAATMHRRR